MSTPPHYLCLGVGIQLINWGRISVLCVDRCEEGFTYCDLRSRDTRWIFIIHLKVVSRVMVNEVVGQCPHDCTVM